jgi:8-amino-7-oxononanoate synthase
VLKEHLINHARTFIFSTAMPPYMAGQIRAALHLASKMDAQREALLDRARQLASALAADGWDTCGTGSQIVPVVIGKNEDTISAAEHLQRGGFAVRAIRPPTVPAGSARLRFSLTAAISQAEIDRLQKSLSVWRAQQQTPVAAGHA